jgi:hypothetical protein
MIEHLGKRQVSQPAKRGMTLQSGPGTLRRADSTEETGLLSRALQRGVIFRQNIM